MQLKIQLHLNEDCFATSVIETGECFATSVIETGGVLRNLCNETGDCFAASVLSGGE